MPVYDVLRDTGYIPNAGIILSERKKEINVRRVKATIILLITEKKHSPSLP